MPTYDMATYEADAYEGDVGLLNTDIYAGTFDTPAGLPGYELNTGVPGTTVTPFDPLIPGTQENSDLRLDTGFDQSSMGGLNAAMNSLPGNLLSGVSAATPGSGSGGSAQQQAIPGAIGGDTDQAIPSAATGGAQAAANGQAGGPGAPPPIPPLQFTSGGGTLSADVPFADDSLVSALVSAYSGAGGSATLVADTVTLSGTSVMAGDGLAPGIAYGVEGGSAPQFHGGSHIFYPTVQAWYDDMVAQKQAEQQQQQQQAQAAGDGALADSGGGGVPQQTNNAIDQAINNAVSGFGDSSGTPGGQLPDTANQGMFDQLANGGNDIWSSPLGGVSDVAHSPPEQDFSSPLGGIYSAGASTAAGFDDPNAGFYGLGHDPVDNTVSDPGDNIWSSPLGGIY